MSRSFKILLIFLFQIPSSHFLFSPLFLSICSLILSLLQLGLDYNFHKTSSFLNGFTLRTPKSRSRLIQMLSHPFALACSLAHKSIRMKTNLMECHQGKQEKGGDEQDGLLPHTGNGTNSRFNWNL